MQLMKCFLSVVICLLFIQRDVVGGEQFEELLEGWAAQHAKITTLEFHYRAFTQGSEDIHNLAPEELDKIIICTDFTSEREKLRVLTSQLLRKPELLPVPWSEAIFMKAGQKIRDDSSILYVEDGVNRIYKFQHATHDQIGINGFPNFAVATKNFGSFVFDPTLLQSNEATAAFKLVRSLDGHQVFQMKAENQVIREFDIQAGNVQRVTTFSKGKPYEVRWFRDYQKYADGISLPKGTVTAHYQSENGITLINVKVIDRCTLGLPLDDSLFRVSARKGSSLHDFRKPGPRGAMINDETADVTVEQFRPRAEPKER